MLSRFYDVDMRFDAYAACRALLFALDAETYATRASTARDTVLSRYTRDMMAR